MKLKRELRIRLRRTVSARIRSLGIIPKAIRRHCSDLRANGKALLPFLRKIT